MAKCPASPQPWLLSHVGPTSGADPPAPPVPLLGKDTASQGLVVKEWWHTRLWVSPLDHPCCHSSFMSELHMAWPFLGPSLGPFSSPSIPLQVSSSANFSSAHAGDSLTTITVPNHSSSLSFWHILVDVWSLSQALCIQAMPMSYMIFLYSSSKLPLIHHPPQLHLSSGLACTHLSSSPDKCSLMGLWSATIKIPLWIVIGCLFLTVNLPVP